jgi:dinuclear metal center YbgI/SA1388 family protein
VIILDDLTRFLNDYMGYSTSVARIDAHMANGLQVRGREEVQTIVTGVSASMRFFEEATALEADALVVHHALNMPACIHFDHIFSNRLRYLMQHRLSLFGYHYLLDCHPEIGNNVQIIKALGGKPVEPYLEDGWGWTGRIQGGAERDRVLARCTSLFLQQGVQYPFGSQRVENLVVLSGSGAPRSKEMEWLIQNKIDLFITGEAREWTREMFREAHISFVAGGHYHTERMGIQALSDVLRRELDVSVKFLDLPNPV